MDEPEKRGRAWLVWCLVVLAAFAMYIGAYAKLVCPLLITSITPTHAELIPVPWYVFGGRRLSGTVEAFFLPIHKLDRNIRPLIWQTKKLDPATLKPL